MNIGKLGVVVKTDYYFSSCFYVHGFDPSLQLNTRLDNSLDFTLCQMNDTVTRVCECFAFSDFNSQSEFYNYLIPGYFGFCLDYSDETLHSLQYLVTYVDLILLQLLNFK